MLTTENLLFYVFIVIKSFSFFWLFMMILFLFASFPFRRIINLGCNLLTLCS